MSRSRLLLLIWAIHVTTLPAPAPAAECGGAAGCHCHVQCPQCQAYCKVSVEKEKVKHYCWEVECETICIPRVHFPWECACPPKCARVKTVRVLKKEEYECEECKYKWTPVTTGCGCGQGGTHTTGCAATRGSSAACDLPLTSPEAAPPVPSQAPSEEVAPEPQPLTGRRPTWFDSAAKQLGHKVNGVLPVRFQSAASE